MLNLIFTIFYIVFIILWSNDVNADARGIIVQYHNSGIVPTPRNSHILRKNHYVEYTDILFDRSATSQEQLHNLLEAYRADSRVVYAEPNYLGKFTDAPEPAPVPSDPFYAKQWWAESISMRSAWAISTGVGVKIAVIDTGVDKNHPDLVDNLLVNEGFNFGNGVSDSQDQNGHGTAIAGLIAASCNNAIAGCGLAYNAKILPIKINPGKSTTFDSATLAQSIQYAIQHGAKIINLSLTVDEQTKTVASAIDQALAAGVIVVAAAGNSASSVKFPANYPGVIGVAATDSNRALFQNSSHGSEIVVAAPGVDMTSTLLGGGFGSIGSGTSFSAPLVSAIIAQMLEISPRLKNEQIKRLLASTSIPIMEYPFGHLDASTVLYALLPDLVTSQHIVFQNSLGTLDVTFQVPATSASINLYYAIKTPWGNYSLRSDGKWYLGEFCEGIATLDNYQYDHYLKGVFFGKGGIYSSINISDLPIGEYTFRTCAVSQLSGKKIGPILSSSVIVR